MRRIISLTLALMAAGLARPAVSQEAPARAQRFKLLAGRFYAAGERPHRAGREVCAILKAIRDGSTKPNPTFLYLMGDSSIAVESLGTFQAGALTADEFRELFTRNRILNAQQGVCAPGEAKRQLCVQAITFDATGNEPESGPSPSF